ncbi:MAG TPA: acetylornithine transaminase [Gemmatimonadaceae bacterium]|nr:acetylornithine transaminase [Gemmatimonadaceae bacterium]
MSAPTLRELPMMPDRPASPRQAAAAGRTDVSCVGTAPTGASPTAYAGDSLLPVYRRMPIEIVRGEGICLVDATGRSYLDFTSGIAVNALGYGDASLARTMRDAIDSGIVHVSNLFHTAPARALADALVARSFADSVFFCNSGAEANEGAFKFARRWARAVGSAAKHEIIALRGSFHGRLFATLAATDRPAYRAPFRPLAPGITVVERELRALTHALDGERVAAVIVEPVQGEGGVRVLDPEFLRELRALTRERDVLLIADEIQCGLGRTGRLFGYEHADIEPDIATLAKPLGGGLPIGAVLLSGAVAAAVQPGDHGSTFGGGPFVATVALHVLDRLSDPALMAHVRENGRWLGEQLATVAARGTAIRAVRGIGYLWGVDTTLAARDVIAAALERGLLLCSAGDHTVRIIPPLVASRDELAEGVDILASVLG